MREITEFNFRIETIKKEVNYSHPENQKYNVIELELKFINILRQYIISSNDTISFAGQVRSSPRTSRVHISFTGALLLDEELAKISMVEFFTRMGIPRQHRENFIDHIGSEIRNLIRNSNGSNFTIVVTVDVVNYKLFNTERLRDQDVRRAEEESMQCEIKLIPASKSAINALKRLVFKDNGDSKTCTVCMEEINLGVEEIRMPCQHVFHEGCIVKWLNNGHWCPLCAFKLPGEQ